MSDEKVSTMASKVNPKSAQKPSDEALKGSKMDPKCTQKPSSEAVKTTKFINPSDEAVKRTKSIKPSVEAVRMTKSQLHPKSTQKPSDESVKATKSKVPKSPLKPSGEAVMKTKSKVLTKSPLKPSDEAVMTTKTNAPLKPSDNTGKAMKSLLCPKSFQKPSDEAVKTAKSKVHPKSPQKPLDKAGKAMKSTEDPKSAQAVNTMESNEDPASVQESSDEVLNTNEEPTSAQKPSDETVKTRPSKMKGKAAQKPSDEEVNKMKSIEDPTSSQEPLDDVLNTIKSNEDPMSAPEPSDEGVKTRKSKMKRNAAQKHLDEAVNTMKSNEDRTSAQEPLDDVLNTMESNEDPSSAPEPLDEGVKTRKSKMKRKAAQKHSDEAVSTMESNEDLTSDQEPSEKVLNTVESNEDPTAAAEPSDDAVKTRNSKLKRMAAQKHSDEAVNTIEFYVDLASAQKPSDEVLETRKLKVKWKAAQKPSDEAVNTIESNEDPTSALEISDEELHTMESDEDPSSAQEPPYEAVKSRKSKRKSKMKSKMKRKAAQRPSAAEEGKQTSKLQKTALVDYLLEHPGLAFKPSSGDSVGVTHYESGWAALTDILNNMKGHRKEKVKWQETWMKMKSTVKKKALALRRRTIGNGIGFIHTATYVTELDRKVFSLVRSECPGLDIPELDHEDDEDGNIIVIVGDGKPTQSELEEGVSGAGTSSETDQPTSIVTDNNAIIDLREFLNMDFKPKPLPIEGELEDEFIQALADDDVVASDGMKYMISTADLDRVKDIFHQHGMSFAIRHSETNKLLAARLLWTCKDIDYFGMPFKVSKWSKMECINGKRRKSTHENAVEDFNGPPKKRRHRLQSKKTGCRATMKITEVITYPEFAIDPGVQRNLSNVKKRKMKELAETLAVSDDVVTAKRYFITVSKPTEHNHSVMTSFKTQTLAPQLKVQIKKCVDFGITNISTIKTLLEAYVKDNVKGNVPTDSRSFYPTKDIIYNYVCKYKRYATKAIEDEAALQGLMDYSEVVEIEASPYNSGAEPEVRRATSPRPAVICEPVEMIASNVELESSFSEPQISQIRDTAKNILDLSYLIPPDDHELSQAQVFLSIAEQLIKRKLESKNENPVVPPPKKRKK